MKYQKNNSKLDSVGRGASLKKLIQVGGMALLASACTPPKNIFTPESGTHFDSSTANVVIQGLTQTTALCYTTDGSEPIWNNGTCVGGSTQRIAGPVTNGQIRLACDGDTGSSVTRTIKVQYDWSGQPGYTDVATYTLNCGGDNGGGNGGGDGGNQPQNLSLTPTADTYVDAANPNSNFGHESTLLVDLEPDQYRAYLRFSIPELTADLQRATLRLYGTNATPNGPKVYRTDNNWGESTITWNNKPDPSGGAIADTGSLPTGWVEIDVTQAVTSSGNLSFLMIADDIDGFDFASREAANKPQLIIITGSDSGGGAGGESAHQSNQMTVGQMLANNEYLVSPNGNYRFYLQGDGNLVLRDWQTRESIWSSGTQGENGSRLTLQSDGNLVLYTATGEPVWDSNTVGSGADRLALNNDGSLALYQGSSAVWIQNEGNNSGGTGGGGTITHIGTTEVWDSNGENVTINKPSGTRAGDLLLLVLHRTDSYLPLRVDGWNRAAECFKRDNGYDCVTYDDCVSWRDSRFCESFGNYGRGGRDLAQVVFFKRAGNSEPSRYVFDLNPSGTGAPGWAILTALRGANTSNPVRDWANEGCDNNSDSLFPSVYGVKGDMVILSQSFDDATAQSNFNAPDGTTTFGYVSNSDEAGFLYGGILQQTGETGAMKTHGPGASSCKDALVSLTIKPQ